MLVPMKFGLFGENSMIFGKDGAIFSQMGKVCLLNFSANLECFRLFGNFFSQLGKSPVILATTWENQQSA